MRLFKFSAVLFALAAATLLPAAEVVLDHCRSTANWNSFNGFEFKGAKVSLLAETDGLALGYDSPEEAPTSVAPFGNSGSPPPNRSR
jgi:hypothetical protein